MASRKTDSLAGILELATKAKERTVPVPTKLIKRSLWQLDLLAQLASKIPLPTLDMIKDENSGEKDLLKLITIARRHRGDGEKLAKAARSM